MITVTREWLIMEVIFGRREALSLRSAVRRRKCTYRQLRPVAWELIPFTAL
jgi:hypothetical protein